MYVGIDNILTKSIINKQLQIFSIVNYMNMFNIREYMHNILN